jgi:hypothetical protein
LLQVKQQLWGLLAKLGTAQKQKALRGLLYQQVCAPDSLLLLLLLLLFLLAALVAVVMLLLLARSLSLVVLAQWVSWAHSSRRASEWVSKWASGNGRRVIEEQNHRLGRWCRGLPL